jgi:hypothetical protein
MKKSTTITYNFETCGGISISELEYKDYDKNLEGEENMLHYKIKKVNNIADNDKIKKIGDIDETGELNETFNKICKLDNKIDETIGISSNNKEWKIHEYKNHKLDKEYNQEYETINFDINYDILQKRETMNYIKDNK